MMKPEYQSMLFAGEDKDYLLKMPYNIRCYTTIAFLIFTTIYGLIYYLI